MRQLEFASPMPTKKRQNPDHNTPTKTKGKRMKQAICPVCDVAIVEGSDDDADDTGDDAVFCEGTCQAWIHRKCVSMSKTIYTKLGNSDDPYLCSYCMIAKQSLEIAELKNIVKDLTSKIDQLSSPPSNQTTLWSSDATPISVLASDNSNNQQEQHVQFVQRQYPPVIPIVPPSRDPPNEMDRRYNVVVYSVEESSSNVSRSQSELEKIVSVLPNVNPTSIKDFHHLGKLKKTTQERPRPSSFALWML